MKKLTVVNYIVTENGSKEISSLDKETVKLILNKLKLAVVKAEARR